MRHRIFTVTERLLEWPNAPIEAGRAQSWNHNEIRFRGLASNRLLGRFVSRRAFRLVSEVNQRFSYSSRFFPCKSLSSAFAIASLAPPDIPTLSW